jgi:hypothetical protein
MLKDEEEYTITFGVSGACKGSSEALNSVGCNNIPTHLQRRTFGGVKNGLSGWLIKPYPMLVAWCCECYRNEGGEDCSYNAEEEYEDE